MKLTLGVKINLLILSLLIISSGSTGYFLLQKEKKALTKKSYEGTRVEVRLAAAKLQGLILDAVEDVKFLSKTPPIQGIIRARRANGIDPLDGSPEKLWRQRLELIFKEFVSARSRYLHIRYIGKSDNGREIVRAQNFKGKSEIVKAANLQSKGHRPYFKEAIKLPKNKIYLSKITLNRDFGKITKPYTAVIRAIVPVYDSKGNIFGIVAVNMNLAPILSFLVENDKRLSIVNDDGNYLAHHSPELTFGFDLGKRHRVQDDFPQLNRLFDKENTDQEFFDFSEENSSEKTVYLWKQPFDPEDKNRFIGLIHSEKPSEIMERLNVSFIEKLEPSSKEAFFLILGLLVIILVIGFYISRRLILPLRHITSATARFAEGEGNETLRLPVRSNDEIGTLAKSFQNMVRKVNERNHTIREKEDFLRATMDNMIDAVITIDKDGLILSTNPATKKLFGYSSSELMGKNVKMLMPEPYKSEHDQYLKNYLTTGNAKIIGIGREITALRKDGYTFPAELGVNKVTTSKGLIFLGTMRDITERRKLMDQIVMASEGAKKANKAKSEFLAKMSHELRTPLNSILGFSQLELIKGNAEGADKLRDANIRQIMDSGKHLLCLVNEVLDLSRIESGTLSLSMEPTDINFLLDEVCSRSKPLGAKKNISLELDRTDDAEQIYINTDRVRLKQVLLNLVSNGIKYNREGETTTVAAKKVSESKVRVSVVDQGKGISKDKLERIFTPFDRMGAEKTEVEGVGIGLTIAKQLTEAMQGTIGVNSVENKGSEFYVEFATCLPPETRPSDKTKETDYSRFAINLNGKQVKILYIEDNPANMELLSLFLSSYENIEFLQAAEPTKGLELAKTNVPDLILLDMHLPGMDGFQVFNTLNQSTRLKDIPVIALSADVMQDDIDKALNMGFHSYLVKPLDISLLCEKINSILV